MKKALIIQNKYIGDVLVASVIAKNLKRILPGVEVHFFCYEKAKAVLDDNPYVDKIIYFNNKKLKNISVLLKYAKQIKQENYDYLIDPYSKLQSRIITALSGAKTKISYDKTFFNFLYDYTVKKERKPKYVCCTSIENRLRLLTPIESDMSTFDFQTEIFLNIEEKKRARKEMSEKGVDFSKPVIMIGALGSSLTKSLPLESMAEVINHLMAEYDANFILNYVPNQQKDIDKLLSFVKDRKKLHLDILGKDVRELLGILSQTDVLIGNEGGAINMAKALNVPTFSIFSPHKFREDWGCYENEPIHSSVHLEDIEPGYTHNLDLKATIQNPTHLYSKIAPNFIYNKLDGFLQSIGIFKNENHPLKTTENNVPKISALLITKNEEKNIEAFLRDLDFADEIIIVDSLSTDKTKELSIKHEKVRFIERPFDNFSNQKNYAIDQAQHPWILFFDTDERISRELKAEILHIITSENPYNAYFVNRTFYFLDKPMHFSGWQNDRAIRLFKNGKGRYCDNKYVHETLQVDGEVGILENPIDHYSLTDLNSYIKKLDMYAHLKAEELYKSGKKANFIHYKLKPWVRFMHHFVFRFGFLDGKNGYTMAKIYKNYVIKRYVYLDKFWENDRSNEIRSSEV